jgi:hypothetical protein
MSEQERDLAKAAEDESGVEGHAYRWGRGDAEAPEEAGERSEDEKSDEPGVEAHAYKWNRGDAEVPEDAGEQS